MEASFRNFLAEAIEQMPLPAILRFDSDRQQRLELQEKCRSLQRHNAQLKQACNQWSHCNLYIFTLLESEISYSTG